MKRDDESEPRTFGAEVDWYAANGRVAPRNGAIRSSLELALVRGFEKRQDIIHYFGTQQSRASLAHTPRAVLLSLPGFSVELVEEILRRRSLGSVPSDVLHLAGVLSEGARDSLMSQQGSLAGRIAMEPDGWVFTSRGRVAGSEVTCVLEVTVTRSGSGTQITRRREWWE